MNINNTYSREELPNRTNSILGLFTLGHFLNCETADDFMAVFTEYGISVNYFITKDGEIFSYLKDTSISNFTGNPENDKVSITIAVHSYDTGELAEAVVKSLYNLFVFLSCEYSIFPLVWREARAERVMLYEHLALGNLNLRTDFTELEVTTDDPLFDLLDDPEGIIKDINGIKIEEDSVDEFIIPDPIVKAVHITDIGADFVNIEYKVANIHSNIKAVIEILSEQSNSLLFSDTIDIAIGSSGKMSTKISGLAPETQYFVRMFINYNGNEISCTHDAIYFKTGPEIAFDIHSVVLEPVDLSLPNRLFNVKVNTSKNKQYNSSDAPDQYLFNILINAKPIKTSVILREALKNNIIFTLMDLATNIKPGDSLQVEIIPYYANIDVDISYCITSNPICLMCENAALYLNNNIS